jgi:hypothetical protein
MKIKEQLHRSATHRKGFDPNYPQCLETMTVAELDHAITCAYDCGKGAQAAPYESELKTRPVVLNPGNFVQAEDDPYADSAKLFGVEGVR